MIDIASVQIVNLIEFGSGITATRLLNARDYEFAWEPESNTITARHRATNRARVIPMSNVVAWEPDVNLSVKIVDTAPDAQSSSEPASPRRGRPPKIRPAE